MLEENNEEPEIPAALRDLPEWPDAQKLLDEKELLGFYVSGHPLTPLTGILNHYVLHKTTELKELPGRSVTRLGGLVAEVKRGISKKSDKPYATATLEDMHGTVTVLCVNENYEKFNDLLQVNQPLMVIGEVNNSEDTPKIFPQEIMPLEDAPRKFTKQVHLRLRVEKISDDSLESVRALTQAHPGNVPLLLCLRQPDGAAVFVEANERFNVAPSANLQQEANTLFGDDTYYVKVDTEVPEPQRRRRYAKNSNGNGQ